MNISFLITKERWDKVLSAIIRDFILYAPIAGNGYQDYQVIGEDILDRIVYNSSKPTMPLKTFSLLIVRPGFEKVQQMDTCQYPAIRRAAAGEDPLEHPSFGPGN